LLPEKDRRKRQIIIVTAVHTSSESRYTLLDDEKGTEIWCTATFDKNLAHATGRLVVNDKEIGQFHYDGYLVLLRGIGLSSGNRWAHRT
jgi:hypothetical protein